MRRVKIFLVALLTLVLAVAAAGFYFLKSAGIISRADYETVAPLFPDFDRPAVLVLNKTNGFVHEDAIPAANQMLRELAAQNGWDIAVTSNAASHNDQDLARFELVVWNNVSGDVLTDAQRLAFKTWLEQGGGWLGLHGSGGDLSYQWDWYVDTLLGAQFTGHTLAPQFRDADVLVAEPRLALTSRLPRPWRIAREEWYSFATNPRDKGYELLLLADEESYLAEGEGDSFFFNFRMDGEHPLAWRHHLGEGRALYLSIGHQAATYSIPEYRAFVRDAMQWAMGQQ